TAPAGEVRYGMHPRELAKYTQAASAQVIAASCEWKLGYTEQSHCSIKQAWAGHRPKDHLFQPRQAFGLNHAAAHIQDQARQRCFDRADGFADVATDTQALWPCTCLQAMVKRRHDQPDSATVDIAKGVTSDLLVGRADVRTGRAAYAAQRLFEMRVRPQCATPVIDED